MEPRAEETRGNRVREGAKADKCSFLGDRCGWKGRGRTNETPGERHKERSYLRALSVSGKWEARLKESVLLRTWESQDQRGQKPTQVFKGSSGTHEAYMEASWSLSGGSSELHSVSVFHHQCLAAQRKCR